VINDSWLALAGGALIGLAAALLLATNGRIAGISGILGGALEPQAGELSWRLAFLGGLLSAGLVAGFLFPARVSLDGAPGLVLVALAGLLVGFGTRLGNGCTSGHGVCGIGRGSKRSVAATLTFMLVAALTVLLARAS
jgi:uncharacterized membrane protein YedE/YeeE